MIVVGVDFSDGATAAVEKSRRIAHRDRDVVRMVHVVRDPVEDWSPDAIEQEWLRSHWLTPSDLELRRGVPWVELVRAADEWTASMVVTGTHGVTGFQPFRLGTTASEVALHCRMPVLLVPPRSLARKGSTDRKTETDNEE